MHRPAGRATPSSAGCRLTQSALSSAADIPEWFRLAAHMIWVGPLNRLHPQMLPTPRMIRIGKVKPGASSHYAQSTIILWATRQPRSTFLSAQWPCSPIWLGIDQRRDVGRPDEKWAASVVDYFLEYITRARLHFLLRSREVTLVEPAKVAVHSHSRYARIRCTIGRLLLGHRCWSRRVHSFGHRPSRIPFHGD
jgi:hypothetical protein